MLILAGGVVELAFALVAGIFILNHARQLNRVRPISLLRFIHFPTRILQGPSFWGVPSFPESSPLGQPDLDQGPEP